MRIWIASPLRERVPYRQEQIARGVSYNSLPPTTITYVHHRHPIRDVAFAFEDFQYRTPIKFGGVALDKVTILNVDDGRRDRAGKTGDGFGSMPLGNVWAWPSRKLGYDQTLAAMKYLAAASPGRTACPAFGPPDRHHPRARTAFFLPADDFAQMNHLTEPMPKLVDARCRHRRSTPRSTTPTARFTA